MKRKLVTLIALLAGLALAQTTNPWEDSHTVTVNIPSILSLELNATDYLFDFDDTSLTESESEYVTVNNINYTKASRAAYNDFINTATGPQTFAPTSVAGAGGADYGTIIVRTNRAQWTVKIDSIGGTLNLGNDRVKVFAEKESGKGGSWTTTPTPITAASPLTLFNAGSGGQGRSVYKLYYLLEMNINDDIPLTGINSEQIAINLVLTSP